MSKKTYYIQTYIYISYFYDELEIIRLSEKYKKRTASVSWSLLCVHVLVGLPCVWIGLPCGWIGLPCVWIGLPCVWIGLPCASVGLPCVSVGLHCVRMCVGRSALCVWAGLHCVCMCVGRSALCVHVCGPVCIVCWSACLVCWSVCLVCWCRLCKLCKFIWNKIEPNCSSSFAWGGRECHFLFSSAPPKYWKASYVPS